MVTGDIIAVLGQEQGLSVFEGLTHSHKHKVATLLFQHLPRISQGFYLHLGP